MKTKNIVVIAISLLIGIILGVFIDNKFMNKEISSNNENTNQQTNTNTKNLSLDGIKNNEILDKIAGDYLIKISDGELPLGEGVSISKADDGTYNILSYRTHAGGNPAEKIIGLVESEKGDYYTIISVLKEEKNEMFEYLTSVNSTNIDITDVEKGILYVYNYTSKIKHTKYNGDFNDWDKKDEFIKNLPLEKK